MKLHPYLGFDGRCEEAFLFYERHLGAQIVTLFRYEGSPMADQMPPDWRDKILHGQVRIADQIVMGSDAPPSRYEKPQGLSLSLNTGAVDEAEHAFAALAEGGSVQMPLAQTFWALRFGTVTDRFGIPWMINCEQPA